MGFPASFDSVIYLVSGIILALIALSFIREEYEKYSPYQNHNVDTSESRHAFGDLDLSRGAGQNEDEEEVTH